MPGVGDAVSDSAEQATDNLKTGGGGGLAIALGSAVAGPVAGPVVGGTLAGSYLGGDDGDTVTQIGMILAMNNLVNGGASSASSGGSSRGRM